MRRALIVGLAAMVVGVALTPLNLAVGLLIGVVGLGVVAFDAIGGSRQARTMETEDDVNPQFRVYLSPLKKLHAEIEELVRRNSDSTTIRVIGAEALEESNSVLRQAAKMVAAAGEVKRALRGKSEAETDIEDLTQRIAKTESDEEKNTLGRALEARKQEVERYRSLDAQWDSIHANLRQAEAALAEVKARLILVAGKPGDVADGDDELRDQLSRLRALSDSFGESDQMLEERNR